MTEIQVRDRARPAHLPASFVLPNEPQNSPPQPSFAWLWGGLALATFVILLALVLQAGDPKAIDAVGQSLPPAEPRFLGTTVALDRLTPVEQARALDSLQRAGISWVRQTFSWQEIEPEPGQYDWQHLDAVMQAASAHGIEVVAVLDRTPAWARNPQEQNNPAALPKDIHAFGAFAGRVATHYAGQIRSYEIWDEPNIAPHGGSGDIVPAEYVRLLREAAVQIRQAQPGARIVLAGLAPTTEAGPLNWNEPAYLTALYQAGARSWFDVVAMKPYGMNWRADEQRVDVSMLNLGRVQLARQVMLDASDGDKPIWAVEFGWNAAPLASQSSSPWRLVSPSIQQQEAVAALARARQEWPWLTRMGWGPRLEPATPLADARWGFALLKADGSPEPLLATLSQALPGDERAGNLQLIHPSSISVQQSAEAFPGRHSMDDPAVVYEGNWRVVDGQADISQSGDRMLISFWGSQLDLRVRRGPYWAYLQVEVDGQPANALPQSDHQARLILYDTQPDDATWVPVAGRLPLGYHEAVVTAHGGWGQWVIAGFAVSRQASGANPAGLSLLLVLTGGAAWQWLRSVMGQFRAVRHEARAPLWRLLNGLRLETIWFVQLALVALPHEVATWSASSLFLRMALLCALVAGALRLALQEHLPVSSWRLRLPTLTRLDLMLLAFLLVSAASVPGAEYPPSAWVELRSLVIEPLVLYVLIRNSRLSGLQVWRLADALVASAVLVGAVGLWQMLHGQGYTLDGSFRLIAMLDSPNTAAMAIERAVPLAIVGLVAAPARTRRLLYGAACVPLVVALCLTLSRGALMLAMPVALLILALGAQRTLDKRMRWAIAVALGVAVLAVLMTRALTHSALVSILIRPQVWLASLSLVWAHPFLGVGLDGFRYAYPRVMYPIAADEPWLFHPHNLLLEFATRLGLLGVLVLAGLLLSTWQTIRQVLRDRTSIYYPLGLALAASLAAGLAHSLIDAGYFLPVLAWWAMVSLGLLQLMASQVEG